ncbi:hypothetical protein [Paenibacillus dendritiformis]|uniref:hypothetical protein n=1 Tax=Paenibacillus dendritiformis TaxID=130049 RepID=UPI001F54900A|nr:hypothetical protein [Paenibacillus dendritiformis]
MEFRMIVDEVNPAAHKAMKGLESFVTTCGLDPSIIELIKLTQGVHFKTSVIFVIV